MNNIDNSIQKRFAGNPAYPGEQLGMSLDAVRSRYILAGKIYGQTLPLPVGTSAAISIHLPRDGRVLNGINILFAYANAAENPLLTLTINNTKFITSTNVRAIDAPTLGSQVYYPLSLPLSGNDEIIAEISNVTVANNMYINFFYA